MKEDIVIGHNKFSRKLARELEAKHIGVNLHTFPDNEIKPTLNIKSRNEIDGKNILVVSRTSRFEPRPNDAIIELGLNVENLSGLGAKKIDILMPYMYYARQNRSFQRGEPESLAIIANLYENWLGRWGTVENLITMNSHLYGKEKRVYEYFTGKIKPHDISSSKLFADYFKSKKLRDPIIVTPGAKEITNELATYLKMPCENLEKPKDHKTGKITMQKPKTNFRNRDAIIYDDLASSGGTIEPAFNLVSETDPHKIYIALSHMMTEKGIERLFGLGANEVITTDSLESGKHYKKFTELSTVPLFSEYIKKL